MPFHFVKPRLEQSIPLAALVGASLGLVIAAGDVAGAAGARSERSLASVEARAAGEPVMAIVSLRRQQITIYDAEGWILRASVSSGQSGRETPAGIFSVIQKEAEHYSNLYDDAYMPHMQRLTWSGIALHGGVVPGHPASHGCIRLPYGFAERLFDMTSLGMRVIVAPADIAPVSIVHPALFQPKAEAGAVAAARAVEAEEATATAKAELQPKLDAVGPAREAVVAAEAARAAASEEARKTTRDLEPMSVFISRRTQHLYVRQGFEPILDIPVTIRDPDRPIGTHVYTATEQTRGDRNMRWSVVSLVSGQSDARLRDAYDSMRGDSRGNVEPLSGDLDGAKEALDRVSIPKETLDRIAEAISPRSSLIISDEPLSSETGQGTEFVVLLSGEPQGGIKNRRRGPDEARHRRPDGSPYWSSRFAAPYFTW